MTYRDWISKVDSLLMDKHGKGGWAFPLNTPWREFFESGLTPTSTVFVVTRKIKGGKNA